PEISTLSLHDALPILSELGSKLIDEGLDGEHVCESAERAERRRPDWHRQQPIADDPPGGKIVKRHGVAICPAAGGRRWVDGDVRSEEHTSELQSRENL